VALAAALEDGVRALRETGSDVLLVTPFLPRRRTAMLFARRFAVYNSELRRIARTLDCRLLDLEALPAIGALELWADDKVHLRSQGHRLLAYRAADVLGVPDAEALGGLDAALHAAEDEPAAGGWLTRDALPWVWRRLRGRTAGDGLTAKHDDWVVIGGGRRPARAR
jgi:phosphatidylinositol alpha 1,6-mannosyltransferase